jgi:phosphatidate cytidylyltransferase
LLRWRLIAAIVLILPLLFVFWLDARQYVGPPGVWVTAVAVAFGVLACLEMNDLLAAQDYRPPIWTTTLGTVLVIVASAAPELLGGLVAPQSWPVGRFGCVVLALAVSLFAGLLAEMVHFDPGRQSTTRVAMALLVVVYTGVLMSFLVATRMLVPGSGGVLAVFSVVFVVKMADAGAYFTGRTCGRIKLAPRLSPGKTIEGFVGGTGSACLASWLFFAVIQPALLAGAAQPTPGAIIAYGITLAVAGTVGDLAESIFKRDMHRKDSARWIPGLGGVLDLFDSLSAAAPVAFVWWTTGWLGP